MYRQVYLNFWPAVYVCLRFYFIKFSYKFYSYRCARDNRAYVRTYKVLRQNILGSTTGCAADFAGARAPRISVSASAAQYRTA